MISASAGDYAKNIKLTNPSKPKADYSEVYRKYGEETSKAVEKLDVDYFKKLIKNGEIKGNNIISKVDDNTQIVFRQDTGVNAHKMTTKGYPQAVDHYNIEVQTLTPAGKWKSKFSYHIILDELGNIIDSF
jgi:enoyl reductase-like protein